MAQRVQHAANRKKGMIVPDQDRICFPGEVLVRFDGDHISIAVRNSDLQYIPDGQIEEEEASPWLYWRS